MRLVTAFVAFLLSGPVQAVECGLARQFLQPDNGGRNQVSVWGAGRGEPLFFAASLNINTDGTRRSYRVDDYWGARTALNNLCNATTDGCEGLSESELRARRIATEEARAAGWRTDLLDISKLSPSIIPMPGGKPCAEVDGFLVSATALQSPRVADVCDFDRYVDAETVPAVVIPKGQNGFSNAGVAVGDLAVVTSGDNKIIALAVVGDKGPADELGEGSIALSAMLLGKAGKPINYRQLTGKTPYENKAWVVSRANVLIFPRSGNTANPYMSLNRIEPAAIKQFAAWGGYERLTACASEYAASP